MFKTKFVNMFKLLHTEGIKGITRVAHYYYDENKKTKQLIRQSQPFHLISSAEREQQKHYKFNDNIKFSILTPLYNTPIKYLEELFISLQKQTYSNWELCLADASDEQHESVSMVCTKWMRKDNRIKYVKLKKNGGISENTNECLKLATGDYIGLLDHDDILHESALFEMNKYIEKYHADFLYSDEAKFYDKIENTTSFVFKSGFGKDELRSHNYICHFTVFSAILIDKLDRYFRAEFDGSQDHDLVLRLTEKAEKICHVPKVLYYWRVHPGSVSMNLDTKPYAVNSSIRAIKEQLERENEPGEVNSNYPYRTAYRIKYDIPVLAKVCVLIHHIEDEEEYEHTKEILLKNTNYANLEIKKIETLFNESDFAVKLNEKINEIDTEYVVMWNAKCVPKDAEWLTEMLMFAQRKDVGVVGNKILCLDNTIYQAGIVLDNTKDEKIRFLCQGTSDEDQGYEAMLRYVRNVTAVWDGCCMFKKQTFSELVGFRKNLTGYEMIDFCLRAIEHKYINVWTNFSVAYFTGDNIVNVDGKEKFVELWENRIEKEDKYCPVVLRKLNLI